MEDDLIRRRDVLKGAYPMNDYNPETFEEIEFDVVDVDDIKATPAVDAVEVVRCRECIVPHNEQTGCPKLLGVVTMPDFFCGFGDHGDTLKCVPCQPTQPECGECEFAKDGDA